MAGVSHDGVLELPSWAAQSGPLGTHSARMMDGQAFTELEPFVMALKE